MHHTINALLGVIAEGLGFLRRLDAADSDGVLLLVGGEDGERIAVSHGDDAADQSLVSVGDL